MSNVEIKEELNVDALRILLHQAIDAITDNAKLEAIYTLLKDSQGPHESLSIDEYIGAIDESRNQIKEGNFLSTEDLEKESKNW